MVLFWYWVECWLLEYVLVEGELCVVKVECKVKKEMIV